MPRQPGVRMVQPWRRLPKNPAASCIRWCGLVKRWARKGQEVSPRPGFGAFRWSITVYPRSFCRPPSRSIAIARASCTWAHQRQESRAPSGTGRHLVPLDHYWATVTLANRSASVTWNSVRKPVGFVPGSTGRGIPALRSALVCVDLRRVWIADCRGSGRWPACGDQQPVVHAGGCRRGCLPRGPVRRGKHTGGSAKDSVGHGLSQRINY